MQRCVCLSQTPSSHISRKFRELGEYSQPSAVHLVARVSGPSQHTWPTPPQPETHLLVVMSQPKPCWQLTTGPKAGIFCDFAGARQQGFPSPPHAVAVGNGLST